MSYVQTILSVDHISGRPLNDHLRNTDNLLIINISLYDSYLYKFDCLKTSHAYFFETLHTFLQRWMKSKLCRLRYLRFRQGLILVQRHARVYLQKRQTAAVKIQAALRI